MDSYRRLKDSSFDVRIMGTALSVLEQRRIVSHYLVVAGQVRDPSRHHFARYRTSAGRRQQSVYMIGLHVAGMAAQVPGAARGRSVYAPTH